MVRVKGHVSLVIHKHRARIVLSSKWNGNVCVRMCVSVCTHRYLLCPWGWGDRILRSKLWPDNSSYSGHSQAPWCCAHTRKSVSLCHRCSCWREGCTCTCHGERKKKRNKTYAFVDFQSWSSITPEREKKLEPALRDQSDLVNHLHFK